MKRGNMHDLDARNEIFLALALAAFASLGAPACGGDSSGDTADAAVIVADDGAVIPAPDAAAPGAPDADLSQLDKFSFFVTSLAALQDLSGSDQGFGGDLRFGETGPGAGLRGADKLCATIAERSMPGAGAKPWRAFLSVSDDGTGHPVNAIDRIGDGPWYDRLGRVLAPTKADLLSTRPLNGDATIANDFPNEDGVPNPKPDATQPAVDNHDMLSGSTPTGRLYAATASCNDWTAATGASTEGKPRVGHSWPRTGGGGGPGGPGGGDINSWMSSLTESGCAPGVNLVETGPPDPNSNTVGSGGGYGGFYCFALVP
jgi:hypothetical protein